MARINLLPWREELRLQKNKEFVTLVVMIGLLAGLAVGATLLFFNNKLNDQKAANELITTENQKLDKALKEIETLEQRKEEIISRMKVIQDLQGKRPIPVRVWDDLARAVPDMLFLTQLERKGDQLILSGKAENPNIVSALISNLDRSQWMGSSSVQFIEKGEEVKIPDRNSKEVIYPENSYVGFQVTTTIQMSTEDNEGKKSADAEGTESEVTTVDDTQSQEEQQTQTSENSTTTDETQQPSDSTEETESKAQEPQKESDNQSSAKQENSEKSQESDKEKTEDDSSNASQDDTAKSSDDTAEDGGDT